jgi:hypothetical protein
MLPRRFHVTMIATFCLCVLFVHSASAQRYVFRIDVADTPQGVMVTQVDSNGPAARLTSPNYPGFTSMHPGNIIVSVNYQPTPDKQRLAVAMSGLAATGGRAVLTLRNSATGVESAWNIEAVPAGDVPPPPGVDWPPRSDYDLQVTGQIVPGGGLQVTSVQPGGAATRVSDPFNPANVGALEPGDLILAINGVPIQSQAQYRQLLSQLATTAGKGQITIRNVRNGLNENWNVVAARVTGFTPNPDPTPVPNPAPWPPPFPGPDLTPNPNPVPAPGTRRVHFVICGQSATGQAGFDASVKVTMSKMRSLISDYVDPRFVATNTFLTETQCTAQNIMQTIQNLNASPGDSIFFFYSGHGARDAVQGHFLDLGLGSDYGDLPRTTVANAIRSKNVRLAVMITESCNQSGTARAKGRTVAEQRTVRIQGLTGFERLLLQNRGFIDVNSADEGQLGWGNPTLGGFFSNYLAMAFSSLNDAINWNGVIETAGNNANQKYQELRQTAISSGSAPVEMQAQSAMTPRKYAFQVGPDPYNVSMPERDFTIITTIELPGG